MSLTIAVENDLMDDDRAGFRGRGRGGGRGGRFGGRNARSAPYGNASDSDDDARWAHDKFEELERDFKNKGRGDGDDDQRYQNRRGAGQRGAVSSSRITLENLHWGVSKEDLTELLGAIGPLVNVKLQFDKSGRSLGTASAVFKTRDAAAAAVKELDGRTLDNKEMKVSLSLVPSTSRLAGRLGGRSGNRFEGRLGARVNRDNDDDDNDGGRWGKNNDRRRNGGGRGGRNNNNSNDPSFTVSLGRGGDRDYNSERRGGGNNRQDRNRGGGGGSWRGRDDRRRGGGGGRGRGGGRGGGRDGGRRGGPVDEAALDAELDNYMKKN